ncbi:beta-galactosidase [Plantactinospora sp. S1510]|uniref:Beta-galactosidase n=1 Tax=Plantactinospora alkalitolerans TaxID=2789879 RepID=A0ABS0GQL8_9ACTN|nr:beta-galactosidase [Plantactinospora alkalitolerans]MBF9128202.1 beta-galactosidase [Plantactinospora alkalitolerans]
MRWPKGLAGLCYGGDYNPEQWPPELWPADVELMRRARVNLVTVGVFAWSRLEPQPGRYDFEWLDRVLDLLHSGGIRVALATPTASPPPWFSLRHPEGLPVTADGVRLSHGSRDTYCVSAPAYRAAARNIASALAARYRDHPALALWHVHNEYGTTCHCEHVAAAFRTWLRVRYVELDRLNEAWTGSFWSQFYSEWEQIRPPRATQYLGNPSQLLDFRRFGSDELLAAYVEQRDLLRAVTPDVPVTTNYVLGGWVPVDHTRWSGEVDLVAVDHYPTEAGAGAEEQTAFAADLARSWGRRAPGGPAWLLMESAPNLVLTPGRMHAKEPGRMIRHSLAHVARGSRGAMFFQWRASRGGAELFHSALLPHAGPQTRAFTEAVALGATLERLAEADTGVVQARVAIAWDATCWWAMQAAVLPSEQLDYLAEVSAAHRALWRAGHGVDMVAPGDELSGYALLVLPALYLVSDAYARQVRDYVAAGGHLVVGYFSGIADEHARVRPDGYPGAFRDLLGIRVEEFHPLDAAARLPLSDGTTTGRIWSETVRLTGAEPVLTYVGGVLDGQPAVTRHRYGDGLAWYVSTRPGDDAYRELLAGVAAAAGVGPTCPTAPDGVEAVRRRAAGESWLFLLNHTDTAVTVPASGVDLLTGVRGESVTLPAGGCAVLRET